MRPFLTRVATLRAATPQIQAEGDFTIELRTPGAASTGPALLSGNATVRIEQSANGMAPKCKVGDVIVRVDPRYFRPTEVETLLGDPSKAKAKLGWTPTTDFRSLVREMVVADYHAARRDSLLQIAGFATYDFHE